MRRADFDQDAAVHDRNLIGNRQRFGLIVGDENRRDVRSPLQRLDLRTHLHAQFRIKVAERLVEQHHLGLIHERARERDALLLPAGKLRSWTVFQSVETDDLQNIRDFALDFILLASLNRQRISDIFRYRHVRPDRVGLKDHADRSFVGWYIHPLARSEYRVPGNADLAAIRPLQTRDAAQGRRFAAAAWAQKGVKRSLWNVQRDTLEHVHALLVFAEIFLQRFDLYHFSCFRHLSSERLGSAQA